MRASKMTHLCFEDCTNEKHSRRCVLWCIVRCICLVKQTSIVSSTMANDLSEIIVVRSNYPINMK